MSLVEGSTVMNLVLIVSGPDILRITMNKVTIFTVKCRIMPRWARDKLFWGMGIVQAYSSDLCPIDTSGIKDFHLFTLLLPRKIMSQYYLCKFTQLWRIVCVIVYMQLQSHTMAKGIAKILRAGQIVKMSSSGVSRYFSCILIVLSFTFSANTLSMYCFTTDINQLRHTLSQYQ